MLPNPSLTIPGVVDLNAGTMTTLSLLLERLLAVYLDPTNQNKSNPQVYIFSLLFVLRSLRTNLAYLEQWSLDPAVESGLAESGGS